jgi:translation initiation factor 2 subunit 2
MGEEEGEDVDVAAMLDLSKKKKKKKTKKSGGGGGGADEATGGGGADGTAAAGVDGGDNKDKASSEQRRLLEEQEAAQDAAFFDGKTDGNNDVDDAADDDAEEDRRADYSYGELLDRVVDLLRANNPDLVDKKRTRIKPPQLQTLTTKKTLWVNFQEICTVMQRDPQHVYQFFMAELGTEGNFDGNQRLIIRGKYLGKYIESLLRKYVIEYVTCEMCRSPNTSLVKDTGSRLFFLNCNDCGSRRSVAPIRSGYHATSRADRRAARNAKG